MPEATTIVQVCDAITHALRSRGFFEEKTADADREAIVDAAIEEAGSQLGLKLTPAHGMPGSGRTVQAEGIPGVVTIVAQREIAHEGKGGANDSINPDFGVTWSLA